MSALCVVGAGCPNTPPSREDAYVRAAALLELPEGDNLSAVDKLIEAVADDPDDGVAWSAWHELRRRTGQEYGNPRDPAGRREAARGWRQWRDARAAQGR